MMRALGRLQNDELRESMHNTNREPHTWLTAWRQVTCPWQRRRIERQRIEGRASGWRSTVSLAVHKSAVSRQRERRGRRRRYGHHREGLVLVLVFRLRFLRASTHPHPLRN